MKHFTGPCSHPANRAANVFSKRQWLYKLTTWMVVLSLVVVPTAWGQAGEEPSDIIIDYTIDDSALEGLNTTPVIVEEEPPLILSNCSTKDFLFPSMNPYYYQGCLTPDHPEAGRPPSIISAATIAALKEYSDCAICIAQELFQHAPTAGEALLMAFTLLGTSKDNPNENDRLAVEWLENRIKETRIQAATVAKAEHDRWKQAPCAYTPPAGISYNPSLCRDGALTNLTNIAGVPPPNFGAIGLKVAYSGVASPAASALLKEMNAGLKKTLALEATGSIAGGIVVGGATAAAIAAGFGAIFPYATGSASLIAAGATAGTIGAASAGTVGFLMAGPVMVATLVATGIAAIVLMVKASQLSSKLSAAVQRAQNESIDLPALLTTETGREEAWGNFLLATAGSTWTPRTLNCAQVDVSRHLLALPTPEQPNQWLFQHTRRDANSSHTAEIMKYISRDGSTWTAKIVDGQFLHAPNGDFTRAHHADILNYLAWDGTNWTAQLSNGAFMHAPNGDFSRAHRDRILNYKTWDGGDWTTALVAAPQAPKNWRFQHTKRGTGSSHTAEIMNYINGDGSHWTAKMVDGQFLHAPGGDFTRAHRDDILIYRSWDGSSWTVKMVNGSFLHAPNGDFNQAHRASYLPYQDWDGSEWVASLVEEGNL